ncbi:MAG: hypothetical protein LBC99_07615 [Spirochaetota bacterium]|jgi:hypothetical protein|nr:hypothetical protein [Spirochaetota bacterium]
MKKLLLIIIAAMILSDGLFALDAPQISIQNLRQKGMGGVRLSVLDDQYSIMNNPAGPAKKEKKWVSIIQAQATVSGDFFDLFDNREKIINAATGDHDIDNETWNFLSRFKLSVGTTPLYITLLNILPLGFNLAIFDSLNVRAKANPDVPIPTLDFLAYNDTAAVLNFSTEIGRYLGLNKDMFALYVGANAKLIHRIQLGRENMDIFYLVNLGGGNFSELDVRRALAFGMDIGATLALFENRALALSLTLNDFFRTKFSWIKPASLNSVGDILGEGEDTGKAYINPSLCIGAAWKVGTILPWVMEGLILSADIRDIFDYDIVPFLKIYAGFEFALLKVLRIRGGIYQGYLCGGVGIDIPILPLEIDAAYWGEELGRYPGSQRLDNFGVTLNIVF